ncbi:MAG: Maf family nucleotide pyrophosphatase [Paludibacteraceae bacterium]|nr:Maf family nucleotide pyrophosphatase [Paludibacteraceae bacterium]
MLDLKEYNLVLASQSPRRRELLKGLDLEFTTCSVDADESFPAELKGADAVQYICKAKADAYRPFLEDKTIAITADTVVILDNKIIGKPKSHEEAFTMIRSLSGRVHEVITAVCIFSKEKCAEFYSSTEVYFSEITDEEIEYYINKYKPFDKAGSYGVQEWIGYIGIEKIVGSYFNVMGLPVKRLYDELKTFIETL